MDLDYPLPDSPMKCLTKIHLSLLLVLVFNFLSAQDRESIPELARANGEVSYMTRGDGKIFLSGGFDWFGGDKYSSVVAVFNDQLEHDASYAVDNFLVRKVVSDDAGGWYVSAYGTIGHLKADKTFDILPIEASDGAYNIHAMAKQGNILYIAGDLRSIGGIARNYIGAIDLTTNTVTAWNPNCNGYIYSLKAEGGVIYVGGSFTSIGGQTRQKIAAIDASTGLATSWNANVNTGAGYVYTIETGPGAVYFGGSFATVGATIRRNVAAVNNTGALITNLNPAPDKAVTKILRDGSTLYVLGSFENISSTAKHTIAAFNLTTGAMTSFNTTVNTAFRQSSVNDIAVDGQKLFLGGDFTSINGVEKQTLAVVNKTTGASTEPYDDNQIDGSIYALAASGGVLFTGGVYNGLDGISRKNGLAAIDESTLQVSSWYPSHISEFFTPDLKFHNNRVYYMTRYPTSYIGAVNTTDGSAIPGWQVTTNTDIDSWAFSGNTVYITGEFTVVNGVNKSYFAAIDLTSGAVLPWTPSPAPNYPTERINSMLVDNNVLYGAGNFDFTDGGVQRKNLAAWNATTGALLPWAPIVEVSGSYQQPKIGTIYNSEVYIIGDAIAKVDATSGVVSTWSPDSISPGDRIESIAIQGNIAFLAGSYSPGLIKTNINTGKSDGWQPSIYDVYDSEGGVDVVISTSTTLFAGGNLNYSTNDEIREGFAAFIFPPVEVVDDFINTCADNDVELKVLANMGTSLTYQWQKYNGSVFSDISNGSGYGGVTTSTLTVSTSLSFGAGTYRCAVTIDLAPVYYTSTAEIEVDNCPAVAAPELSWAKNFTAMGENVGHDIAVDASGNVYTTGRFEGTVDFDPGPGVFEVTAVGMDAFISKTDAAGNFVWAIHTEGTSDEASYAITIDKDGNIVTTGLFYDVADFDPEASDFNLTSNGDGDFFLWKVNSNGQLIWAASIGGAGYDEGAALGTDAAGNIYVTGHFGDMVDFDPGAGFHTLIAENGIGDYEIFVLKLDADGNFEWAKSYGNTGLDQGRDLTVDVTGNVHVTGQYEGTVNFDPGFSDYTVGPIGANFTIFILKLDTDGNFLWAQTMGGDGAQNYGYSLVTDNAGNVFTTGVFEGDGYFDPDLGSPDFINAGETDIFISKHDASGNFNWVRRIGGSDFEEPAAIARDNLGNIYMLGQYFRGTLDVDPGADVFEITSNGSDDMFILRLDASGNFLWATSMGGDSYDFGRNITSDPQGNIYTIGFFQQTADFNPASCDLTLDADESGTIFVQKLVAVSAPCPAINSSGSAQNVCSGENATIQVVVTGTAIRYQWQRFNSGTSTYEDITNGSVYSGALSSTLQINTTGNLGAGNYRCSIKASNADAIYSSPSAVAISVLPIAPFVTGDDVCTNSTATLSATGAADGDYRWYSVATGGTAISAEVNGSFETPALTTATSYFVSIMSGSCESQRIEAVVTVSMPPAKPVITSPLAMVSNTVTICSDNATLNAPAGFTSYNWSNTETTEQISVAAGTYSVTVTDANGCTSVSSDAISVVVSCVNAAPVIADAPLSTQVKTSLLFNLVPLLSDPDDNLDLTTLKIVSQPESGALASIDANGMLAIDYAGVSFSGTDHLTIEVCDMAGVCTNHILSIEVFGEIRVYNAFSPNGDGFNTYFRIEYIDTMEDTRNNTVSIFNRWGDLVFEIDDYDNDKNVFKGLNNSGEELSPGTYFYRITFPAKKEVNGYVTLRK